MKEKLWRWFMPHTSNDFTPDLLQRTAILVMGGLALLTFTMTNVYALLWQQSVWLTSAVLPAVVVEKTNKEREDLALSALVRNTALDTAARLKAEDMAKNSYFAHYSPDGISPWYWFNEAGYAYVHAGENLAVHFTDSKEVVEAWMLSPTHRANIVNQNYREIGVGTARGRYQGFDTVFVVQLFGTPGVIPEADESVTPVAVAPTPLAPEVALLPRVVTPEEPVVAGIETSSESLETPAVPVTEPAVLRTPDIEPPITEPVRVAATTIEDHGVVVYSDTITTTSDLVEAPIDTTFSTPSPAPVTELAMITTSPSTMMQRVYWVLGLLVIVALITSVAIEWREQRPLQVVYGVLLLCMMATLFYVHTLVTGGVLVT
ncbi:MAG: hypothetical protein RLZZ360_111 [Candidatus Parcubacteria bacterium]|jgi:hypothetical protein